MIDSPRMNRRTRQSACLCLCVILAEAPLSTGQTKTTPADSLAVVSIAQQLLDAVAVGDTAVWNNYILPNCIMITEDGVQKTKADLIKELQPLPPGYVGTIHVTKPVVASYNGTCALSFIVDETLTLYSQAIRTSYAETNTYVNTYDGWRVLAFELFEVPDHPNPMSVRSEILQSYEGVYQLADSVQYTVTVKNDGLYCQRTGGNAVELVPETESVFFVKGQRGTKLFVKDEAGKAVKMIDRRNGHDLIWTRVR